MRAARTPGNWCFPYTVADGDHDPDGVSWAADSLALNGGAIHFTHTEVAQRAHAVITHGARAPDAAHRMDAVAPVFASAAVNGTALTLTFDEALGAASALANSAFTVKKTPYGGVQATVTLSGTPAISGNTVSLTLAAAVVAVDTNVTVSYTRPGTGSNNTLADVRANAVADFTDAPVNNLLSDTTPPTLDTALLAFDGVTLTLTYNEALHAASTPAATAFTVTATPAGGREQTLTVDNVSVSGSTVALTLAGPRAHNDAVTVAYTKPGSGAVIEDLAGNDAATFPARAVTNDSLAPRVTIAAVYPDADARDCEPRVPGDPLEHGRAGADGKPDRHPGRGLPRCDHADHHHTRLPGHGDDDVRKHPVRQQRQRRPGPCGGGGR